RVIPFDWQHAHWWLGMAAFCGALWSLNEYFERREYRRKAALVRANAANQRCARCGGPLSAWDGKFHQGDIHFNPDGYFAKLIIECAECQSANIFYVFDDDFELCNYTMEMNSEAGA